jgi:hypothetical protein
MCCLLVSDMSLPASAYMKYDKWYTVIFISLIMDIDVPRS